MIPLKPNSVGPTEKVSVTFYALASNYLSDSLSRRRLPVSLPDSYCAIPERSLLPRPILPPPCPAWLSCRPSKVSASANSFLTHLRGLSGAYVICDSDSISFILCTRPHCQRIRLVRVGRHALCACRRNIISELALSVVHYIL